jgi:hypothetical protein
MIEAPERKHRRFFQQQIAPALIPGQGSAIRAGHEGKTKGWVDRRFRVDLRNAAGLLMHI